jgi:hypothetical protein
LTLTEYKISISEPAPAWAESTPLQNYALTLGQDKTEGDEDSADESEGQRYRVVAAAKSTKLELKELVRHPARIPKT